MGMLDYLSKAYAGKWSATKEVSLTKEELKEVKKVFIVSSDYGLSACFMFKGGSQRYVPVSNESDLSEGDEVKLDSIKVITLEKDGEAPIYRLDGEPK